MPTNKASRPLCSPTLFVSSFSSLSTLTQSFSPLSLSLSFTGTLCTLFLSPPVAIPLTISSGLSSSLHLPAGFTFLPVTGRLFVSVLLSLSHWHAPSTHKSSPPPPFLFSLNFLHCFHGNVKLWEGGEQRGAHFRLFEATFYASCFIS